MHVSFCELTNLTVDMKRERYLGNGLSIKRIPSYIGRFIDEERGYSIDFKTSKNRWMIYGAPRRDFINREDAEITNKIRVLIDALLICCGEDIQPGAVYFCELVGRNRVNKVGKYYGGVLEERAMGHREMNLTSRQIMDIKRTFILLMDVPNNGFVQIPLVFYREACVSRSRYIPWEATVYLTIALESFFLKKDKDKASMLATRVADFLAKDNQHEDNIYREVFALYKCRNGIVHDGNQWPEILVSESDTDTKFTFRCNDLTKSSYETVRRCLRKILNKRIQDKQALLELILRWSARLRLKRQTLRHKILN